MRKRLPIMGMVLVLGPMLMAQIKIGVINSMSGPEAPIGENITNGIKLAEEDLKKRGFSNLVIIWEDDTGKPQISMSAMEKLATRDNVSCVVGPYTSACANAVAKRAEQYKVPLLVPAAAKEEITQQGLKYVFRMNAPADKYASSLIDQAIRLGAAKTIAFIYENTDFGTSTTQTAKTYAASKNIQVVADEPYPKNNSDYRPTLAKIKAKNPDLVFMVSYVADAILLMRQAKEVQLQPQAFLGGGAGFTTTEFVKEPAANGVISCTQWTDDAKWPGAAEFGKRYKERFHKEPTYHAACAYESMMIIGGQARANGGDRGKIREGLRAGAWDGIMGNVKFTDYEKFTNQNNHVMLVEQVQNGQFETVFPLPFATKKAVYPFAKWK